MHKELHHLKKSFGQIGIFYLPLFIISFFMCHNYGNLNLSITVFIVLFGNLFLGVSTQISNYLIEKYSIPDRTRDFLYDNFTDCFFRSLAGLAEIVLYTISLALSLDSIVAGYLLLKTVSIWQDNVNNKKEGLHTAILRIAIVLSLLISFVAAYFLKKFINNF